MEIKTFYMYFIIGMLTTSIIANGLLVYANTGYRHVIDTYEEYYDVSWMAVTKTMDAWNQTQNYIDAQRQSISELTMLNIAWSMYDITGNVSWFPQSPSEFENVTGEYGYNPE